MNELGALPPEPPPRVFPRKVFWGVNFAILALLWWSLATATEWAWLSEDPPILWLWLPLAAFSRLPSGCAVLLALTWHVILLCRRDSWEGKFAFRRQVLVDILIFALFVSFAVGNIPLRVSLEIWGDDLCAYAEELRRHPDAERSRARVEVDSLFHELFEETRKKVEVIEFGNGTPRIEEKRTIGPFRITSHFFLDGRVILGIGNGIVGLVFDPPSVEGEPLHRWDPGVAFCRQTRLRRIDADWQIYQYFTSL